MPLPFFFVDVFTREPLAGNPLAVVADADDLDDAAMRRIAKEFNQSETTFVVSPRRPDADRRLRFFTTTGAEVYGAGHNALGAWWWLIASGRVPPRPRYTQEIGDRVLDVEARFSGGTLETVGVVQLPPSFGAVHSQPAALAAALHIDPGDLDTSLPAQVVSTGAAHLLVAVRDRAAVERAAPDLDRLVSEVRAAGGQGCYVYSRDPIDRSASAHARFFNPGVGIAEDAATGSAAGPLGCYFVARQVARAGEPIVVEQGYTMRRPSRIEVRVDGERVVVSGSGVVVAEGTLLI